jgi:hypothetical protein
MPKGWPCNGRRNNTWKARRQRHVLTESLMSRMLELSLSSGVFHSLRRKIPDLPLELYFKEITKWFSHNRRLIPVHPNSALFRSASLPLPSFWIIAVAIIRVRNSV